MLHMGILKLMNYHNWKNKFAACVADHSIAVIVTTIAISILLLYPMIRMEPTQQASPNPPGEVYDMQADIDDKFPTPLHFATYVLESRNGDVITADVLREFAGNRDRVINLDEKGDLAAGTLPSQQYLFTYFDNDYGLNITGIRSILEPIEASLAMAGINLNDATDHDVKMAVGRIVTNPDTRSFIDMLSTQATFENRKIDGVDVEWWSSPATIFNLMADNEKLGGAGLEIGLGGGPDVVNKEHLNRRVASVMKGESETYEMWGVAIDPNLESAEEGQTAGLFITFTIIGAVLVVGLSLKSYWITAITGIGLGLLMVWLKGISAIVGLKTGLVIDLVVPVGMISLGVDFVVHAVRRYREEINEGYAPRRALKIGLAGVLAALLLAMASDSIAFLSNLTSSIEAVIHFGSAAAIAVLSSFIILGVVAPVTTMKIDELIEKSNRFYTGWKSRSLRIVGSIAVAGASGGTVIVMLAVDKTYGVLMLAMAAIFFLVIPAIWLTRTGRNPTGFPESQFKDRISGNTSNSTVMRVVERVVTLAGSHILVVLLSATALTVLAGVFAIRLEPTFDVKDFFDSKSEFVIGLDKIDEHLGESGGEPGVVYIRGDLMDPMAVIAISEFVESLKMVDQVAETASGEVIIGLDVLNTSRFIGNNHSARSAIASAAGVSITGMDFNGIPDTRAQMEAAFRHSLKNGVVGEENVLVLRPDQVRGAIYLSESKDTSGKKKDLTTVSFMIPGTRDQTVVSQTADELSSLLSQLESYPSIDRAGLTGSPFTREEQLSASTRTLYTSLPVAIAAATILLLVTMRSVKYSVVTVIPIGLVVAWLYGIMSVAGFALNFVTAMIGAISIGVGIDYSIHMTERFREELGRNASRIQALARAARGTGVALVASAASSVVGFTIMGFAPMPMFASYGQLTAVMITLALLASLVVLPSLLMLVTRESDDIVN